MGTAWATVTRCAPLAPSSPRRVRRLPACLAVCGQAVAAVSPVQQPVMRLAASKSLESKDFACLGQTREHCGPSSGTGPGPAHSCTQHKKGPGRLLVVLTSPLLPHAPAPHPSHTRHPARPQHQLRAKFRNLVKAVRDNKMTRGVDLAQAVKDMIWQAAVKWDIDGTK